MSIQVQGSGGTIAEVDGTVYNALCVTMRPVDYGTNGSYRISMMSGTMAAGISFNDVFQARWTSSTLLALVWKVQLDGMSGSSTAFAAGISFFKCYLVKNWTADGSGGNSATLTGNNNKLRTSMATTSMGAIRISSTAALTAGTRTLDTYQLSGTMFSIGTVASVNYRFQTPLYGTGASSNLNNPMPMVLTQNQGVMIQGTVPGTGTWQFGVTMSWSEVASY